MIATLGEAFNLGWRLRIYCRNDNSDDRKRGRPCGASLDADLETLVWTRGRDFPIARLDTRMKCLRCGSRRVMVAFEPPTNSRTAQTVTDPARKIA